MPSLPRCGVYVSKQLLGLPVAWLFSVQLAVAVLPWLKLPGLGLFVSLTPKVTVPIGVLAVPGLLSMTVAVQVMPTLTGSVFGLQLTPVLVERLLTLKDVLVALASDALDAVRA